MKPYTVYEKFDCAKLSGVARIQRSGIEAPDGTRTPALAHGCDSCEQCGVMRTSNHGGMTVHWGECIHPDLQQASD